MAGGARSVRARLHRVMVPPVGMGAPELLIMLMFVTGIAALVLTVVVVVDASARPDAVWEATGQNRMLWIVLPIALLVACGIGSLIVSIIYLATVRPKLIAAA
jgi:hypothetical protein